MPDHHRRKRHRPIIRVFVSSTFSDLKLERDALARQVWPKLEQLCLNEGFQFQAIDLRWGVSGEAGLHHRTMRICFEELRRAQEVSPQPNFLILLGNRYGWRPLPEQISEAEFKELVKAANSGGEHQQPLPGTHGKTAEEILRDWYCRDENVLVTSPSAIDPDRAPLNYILQPRTQDLGDGRNYTRTKDEPPKDTQDWLDVQQVLWSIINAAFSDEQFARRFDHVDWSQHLADVHAQQHPKRAVPQIVRFQGSATEQEIWCGALSVADAERHVLAFFREITNRDDFAPADVKDYFDLTESKTFDENANTAQKQLKCAIRKRLGDHAVVPIPFSRLKRVKNKIVVDASDDDIQNFCDDVEARLRPIIEQQIDEWRQLKNPHAAADESSEAKQTARELEIEREEHLRFAEERGPKDTFVGREDRLRQIVAYTENDSRLPLVIYGESGCGKTALLARAFQEIPAAKKPTIRFIGVTPRASDLRSLLQNLCLELRGRNPIKEPLASDIQELKQEFRQHLQAATAEQPVVLFLDALDQLSEADGGLHLGWLPGHSFDLLPSHVKIVVSCLSDREETDPAGQPYAALQRRKLPAENMLDLDALPLDEAKALLFERWLKGAGRTVDNEEKNQAGKTQREVIEERLSSDRQCRQPLFLKLLFEEVKLWRSYDKDFRLYEPGPASTNARADASPKPGSNPHIDALLRQLFTRLGDGVNHEPLLVDRALGYIAAARRGLSETEILEVLFQDEDFKKQLDDESKKNKHTLPSDPPRIPIAIWSRLRSDLAPHLTERAAPGGHVLTFYHRQVADWVTACFINHAGWEPHRQLADYFHRQDNWLPASTDTDMGLAEGGSITPKRPHPRKLDELPWHCVHGRRRKMVESVLTDFDFIEAKCRTGMTFDLIADYLAYDRTWVGSICREPKVQLRKLPTWVSEGEQAVIAGRPCRAVARNEDFGGTETLVRIRTAVAQDAELDSSPPIGSQSADDVLDFAKFVSAHAQTLASPDWDLLPLARNHASSGTVADRADRLLAARERPWISRENRRSRWVGRPVRRQTWEGQGYSHLMRERFFRAQCNFDGTQLVTLVSGKLRVLRVETGECLREIELPAECRALAVARDGSVAATMGPAGARVWDLKTGQRLALLSVGEPGATPDTKDRGSPDSSRTSSESPLSVALSAHGRVAVTSTGGDYLDVWNVSTGTRLRRLIARQAKCECLDLSWDGSVAVTLSLDNTLRVWETTTGRCTHALPNKVAPWNARAVHHTNHVAVNASGELGVSSVAGRAVRIWDLVNGRLLNEFSTGEDDVYGLALSADGKLLAVLAHGLQIWDVEAGERLRMLGDERERFGLDSVALNATGDTAVTCCWEWGLFVISRLGVWDLTGREGDQDGDQWPTLASFDSVALAPEGSRALLATPMSGLILLRDLSGSVAGAVEMMGQRTSALEMAAHEDVIFLSLTNARTRLWYGPRGLCLRSLDDVGDAGTSHFRLSADGRTVVTLTAAKTAGHSSDPLSFAYSLKVWDLASGRVVVNLKLNEVQVDSFVLTPDDRFAVTLGMRRGGESFPFLTVLEVWDLQAGARRCSHQVPLASRGYRALSITPDGREAVFFDDERRIVSCDLLTGTCRGFASGAAGFRPSLATLPSDRYLLSSDVDGDHRIRVWDRKQQRMCSIHSPERPLAVVSNLVAGHRLFCVTDAGEREILTIRGLEDAIPIVTAVRGWKLDLRLNMARGLARLLEKLVEVGKISPPNAGAVTDTDMADVTRQVLEMARKQQLPLFGTGDALIGSYEDKLQVLCAWCGRRVPLPYRALAAMPSPSTDSQIVTHTGTASCLDVPRKAHNNPDLQFACPACERPLRANPFVVDRREVLPDDPAGGRSVNEASVEPPQRESPPHASPPSLDIPTDELMRSPDPHRGGFSGSPGHPDSDPNRAAQLNRQYQKEMARYRALPCWKRLFTKPPQYPKGI